MSQEIPFDPFPFIDDPHRQTIISSVFNFLFEPASDQKLVTLPDGDKISLQITTPRDWKQDDLTVVLVHGLCGSHKSPNCVRMAHRLEELGIRVVRFNMRGCGSGKGLSRKSYHSGQSADLFESLKVLKKENPDSPMLLVGFSLGGNISLKLAGELGPSAHEFLIGVITVSPPVDLYSSVLMFADPSNSIYEKCFYRLLRNEVHFRHGKFKELGPVSLPKKMKLYEFDQAYTAPFFGFKNVMDYYGRCSSSPLISEISLPCKILLAEDDPIVSHRSLDNHRLPSNISLFKTKKGGHMGYLGRSQGIRGGFWLDSLLVDWIKEF